MLIEIVRELKIDREGGRECGRRGKRLLSLFHLFDFYNFLLTCHCFSFFFCLLIFFFFLRGGGKEGVIIVS